MLYVLADDVIGNQSPGLVVAQPLSTKADTVVALATTSWKRFTGLALTVATGAGDVISLVRDVITTLTGSLTRALAKTTDEE